MEVAPISIINGMHFSHFPALVDVEIPNLGVHRLGQAVEGIPIGTVFQHLSHYLKVDLGHISKDGFVKPIHVFTSKILISMTIFQKL
jgi:hypothetical protein